MRSRPHPSASRAVRISSPGPFLILLLLCACSVHQKRFLPEDIRPLPVEGMPAPAQRIDGLRQALERAHATNSAVRVLAVHGMITHEIGYSDKWQDSIAAALGLQVRRSGARDHPIVRGYDVKVAAGLKEFHDVSIGQSTLRITRWVHPFQPGTDRLVFYELFWAFLRDTVKNRFLACFESPESVFEGAKCRPYSAAKRNASQRALANAKIKDRFLIQGFADAAVVLSPLGGVLRDDVKQAICILATDVLHPESDPGTTTAGKRCQLAADPSRTDTLAILASALSNTEFFAITHSLGSFLVLDTQMEAQTAVSPRVPGNPTVAERREDADRPLRSALFEGATIFMFANQVSLLSLARLRAVCTATYEPLACPPGTDGPAVAVGEPRTGGRLPRYVAFNDVDDLLGFELPPYMADLRQTGTLVNVTVRNPGSRVPGLFKGPSGAHTRHGENAAILDAVVNGILVPAHRRH
jgi:hypothetical protein